MIKTIATQIEKLIQQDVGNRGIKHFAALSDGGLFSSCNQILSRKHIAVCTGFNIPPPENDGPLGALWIAHGCLRLGKKVTLVTDVGNSVMIDRLVAMYLEKSVGRDIDHNLLNVVKFPERDTQSEQEAIDFAHQVIHQTVPPIDHVISIERVGPALDGHCYSMRGRDITHLNGRVEAMFHVAHGEDIFTSGIGDGGNEIGMANVKDQVHQFIPNGDKIACSVSCNSLMVCGVSNWAGYAICALLQAMSSTKSTDEKPWLSVETDRSWLEFLTNELQIVDGVRGVPAMSVDGLDYEQIHAPLIEQIVSMCKTRD